MNLSIKSVLKYTPRVYTQIQGVSNFTVFKALPFSRISTSQAAFRAVHFPQQVACGDIRVFGSYKSLKQNTNLLVGKKKSLAAVPIYRKSPASLGIDGWFGYESIIAPDTTLPCTKSVVLRSALDNLSHDTIKICGYLPMARLRIELAQLTLHGIQRRKKEKTNMKATMVLQNDLSGKFTVRFSSEKARNVQEETSVDFNALRVLNLGDKSTQIDQDGQPLSFLVVDGSNDDTWIH